MSKELTCVDCIEDFNRAIEELIQMLNDKVPNDIPLLELQNRLSLAIITEPQLAMIEAGPKLEQYKDKIAAEDDDFFLQTISDGMFSDADFKFVFKRVFELKDQVSKRERKKIFRKVKTMTKRYLQYKSLLRL
jgi:hypothetical protein